MPPSVPIELGAIIAGKYRVERVLGEGGMGVVVAAEHTQLHHRVAIKFLLPSVLLHEDAVARFAREARAAVRIQSEHVARVLDVGELENGAPYMVMEYLHGVDLADMFGSTERPSATDSIEYVLQACEAIAEAHSLGIVHRDLKPGNLFVARRPDGLPLVKVLDFGISKAMTSDPADQQLTKTQTFMGSVLYASPEQLLSARSVDARTDIWALGVILYQACAGVTPFTGDSVMEIAAGVLQLTPRSLGELRPDLPPTLSSAVMRCLEKDVAKRFANVGDLARALGPHAPHAAASVARISRLMPEQRVDRIAVDVNANLSPNDPAGRPSAVDGLADTRAGPSPAAPVSEATLLAPPLPAVIASSTQSAWGQTQGGAPKKRPRLLAVVIPAALLIGVAGTVLALRRPTVATVEPVPTVPAVPAIPSAPPVATPTVVAVSEVPSSASLPLSPPVLAPLSPSASSATAPRASAGARVPTPRASATTSASSSPPPTPEPASSKNVLDIKIR